MSNNVSLSNQRLLFFYRMSSNLKTLKNKCTSLAQTFRTHTCGELNFNHINEEVTLSGWLEYQRMNCFGVLRDGYGSTQIIIPKERNDLSELLKNVPIESVVSVQGVVKKRPENQIKKESPTGEVEIEVNDITVLNAAKQLPFYIRDHNKAIENLRIKYRYLDLRFPTMQRNLRERSRFIMKMRNFLADHEGFVEVETPTLFRKTPGGAQEFVVPTKNPGEFFSLVQSPQQLKQLLMVGSIDKYFQVARCYRDETARPDRQPEFTQLDIEMSFCSVDDVIDLIERLLVYSWPKPLNRPFKRMTYLEALQYYGTDQPDISFKCLISEVKYSLNEKKSESEVFAVKVPQGAEYFEPSLKKELDLIVKDFQARLEVLNYIEKNEEKINKTLNKIGIDPLNFINELSIKPGDTIFVSKGPKYDALLALGKWRVWFLRWLRTKGFTGDWDSEEKGVFLWLTDFPLFETTDSTSLKSVHHPFTMPHPDDMELLHSKPLKVRSLHYDLVLDGYEVGGGSVRIHDSLLQEQVLSLLDIPTDNLQHLLEALSSGAPPHAGIALGVDRLVSLMVGANSIRDVIAFPKTSEGKDPLSGAPSQISSEDLKLYKITTVK